MNKSNIFLSSLLSFLLGIALHSYFPFQPSWYLVACGWLLLITIVLYAIKHFIKSFPIVPIVPIIPKLLTVFKVLTILTILLFAFALGVFRAQSTTHIPSPETVDYYTSEERNQVTIIGTIAEEPDVRRDKINYTLKVSQIKTTDSKSPNPKETNENFEIENSLKIAKLEIENLKEVSGYTLISTGKYPQYNYGDQLEVTGYLQAPPVFDTFDYAGYLSRYSIYSVMYRPRVKLLESPGEALASLPSPDTSPSKLIERSWKERARVRSKESTWNLKIYFFSQLLSIKAKFEYQMNRTFATEPSSSFIAGLLLGSRKGIPEQLSEDFRITGLTHIIAISGYNITLVVTILMALFRPLGKKPAILISALGIILFTLFVGASPAVVRACIMGLIALLALNSDRQGNITLTLVLTACLMIAFNPKILFYDVGFHLSFLATMGLIYVSPLLEPYLKFLPNKLAIRESILLCLSAQIMALPVILYNFNNLSLVSPLSNLLIAGPIIPLAMLFGFIGTITSFIFLPLAKIIAYPAYLLLLYIVKVTQLTASIPYASLEISWFDQALFYSYFALLSLFLVASWQRIKIRWQRITHYQLQFQQSISHQVFAKKG